MSLRPFFKKYRWAMCLVLVAAFPLFLMIGMCDGVLEWIEEVKYVRKNKP